MNSKFAEHGILLLDKPRGITSNAALTRAKRVLGIRKAGHTGALDPLATGLLPLCFGQATKVSAYLLDADKRYLAEIILGESTASGDAEGELVQRRDVPDLTGDDIELVLEVFRGEIEQVPPMYSALKHKGQRLHELARAGIEVERKPRRVIIHGLDLIDFKSPRMVLQVHCSKGTYIRSLAMDIGASLGCGAHLSALRREASGPFDLADAVTLDALAEMGADQARNLMLPPDTALPHVPCLELDDAAATALGHGKTVRLVQAPEGLVRIYNRDIFMGLCEADAHGTVRVRRLFKSAKNA